MADDPIARRAQVLFADAQRGNVACFSLSRLEHILRDSHARGRREMAQQCAEAIRPGLADSDGVHVSAMADQFDLCAKEAEAEDRHWL